MIIASSRFLASSVALAAALSAQTLTITDGNMNVSTSSPSATSHTPVGFSLRADALAINHGYQHWWYYRVAGDTREYAIRNIGGMTGASAPFLTHADRDFADLDSRGLLRANLDFDVYDAGPASGVVTSRITLTNLSATPVTFDLFNYTDLDIAGTSNNDQVTGNGTAHVVTDSSGVRVEIRAPGADRSDALDWGSVLNPRTLLADAAVNDLSNALPPFLGDYTGAFQWQNRTLQPFEQRSWTVVMAVDTAANVVPEVAHYGTSSGLLAEIYTDTLPLQDNSTQRQIGIQLKNAVPGQLFGLLSNTSAVPGVPFANVQLWVDPNLGMSFPIGVITPTGEMNAVFQIPTSPYLTGFPIYHQYFFLDPTAPNGESHWTHGLMTKVGRL
jgi:hypothetical protein